MMNQKTYVITGPTSGIGLATALEMARHGTLLLAGRDPEKLRDVVQRIKQKGGDARPVLCDLSEISAARRAAAEIAAMRIPLSGILNNAGIRQTRATRNSLGWDMSFATNHAGPFAFTETLLPSLPDGARILFVASAVENPDRKPAKLAGFRGARYISAEASARGEWTPGGSTVPGFDAYATTKQCALAAAFELARENPRLRINAVEPGIMPSTGLGRDEAPFHRFITKFILGSIFPFLEHGSTPKRAARVITRILTEPSTTTGIYFDEKGRPMSGSALVNDPAFTARVVAETRALLAAIPA